jgi:hypothetical protein
LPAFCARGCAQAASYSAPKRSIQPRSGCLERPWFADAVRVLRGGGWHPACCCYCCCLTAADKAATPRPVCWSGSGTGSGSAPLIGSGRRSQGVLPSWWCAAANRPWYFVPGLTPRVRHRSHHRAAHFPAIREGLSSQVRLMTCLQTPDRVPASDQQRGRRCDAALPAAFAVASSGFPKKGTICQAPWEPRSCPAHVSGGCQAHLMTHMSRDVLACWHAAGVCAGSGRMQCSGVSRVNCESGGSR